jgi:transmembrane sensor
MDASERRRRAGEEAAEWWVLLDSEDVALETRTLFVDWLRESALHVEEMLRIAQVHGALEQFQHWATLSRDETGNSGTPGEVGGNVTSFPLSPRPSSQYAQRAPRPRRTWLGVGFATAAAALLALWLGGLPKSYTVTTGQGERRALTLADGSVVQVDPETGLQIRFDSQLRQIDLQRGRARFRVAKNPNRPFLVRAGGTVVRAVGTEFGVEHRSQGIVVTVAEGRVAVMPHNTEPFPLASPGPSGEPATVPEAVTGKTAPAADGAKALAVPPVVLVSSGQQLTVSPSGSAHAVREVNAERELSWAEGRLSFENDSVSTVVETFNRYNHLQIHVADSTLARRTMSGVFSASDPESFVAFLRSTTSVRVERSGRDITIASAR